MPAVEIGRVCLKKAGREAGRKCVIIDLMDRDFVLVTGPPTLTGVKRRRSNLKHLELTEHKIDVDRDCEDEQVLKAIEVSQLQDFFTNS